MCGMKVKKGDQIKIITGNDRGKTGKVLAVLPELGKLIVEGINIKKKHVRPRSQGKKGELVRIPAPVNMSNVMIFCSKCNKPARIGYKIDNANKIRICKKCGNEF